MKYTKQYIAVIPRKGLGKSLQEAAYACEVQQKNEGASPRRSRYHSGLVDMNTLEAGQKFEELPDSYVIFLTREDVLGYP